MRGSLLVIATAVSLVLSGCVDASKKANELANPNLYQEIQYVNVEQPGPTVLVLPPQVTSSSYEFKARVLSTAIRDLVEMELGKGNFKVVDRSNQEAMFQELAIAVNMGSSSVVSKFKKFKHAPPQWMVAFDIVDVQTRSTGFRHLDKTMASLAGAAFSSLTSAEEQREWAITLRYRIYDGIGGEILHEGQFSDKTTVFREIKGFMGFDQAQAGGVQMLRSVQSLVQMAVKDIDEKHKLPAMAQAEEVKAKHAKALAKAAPEKSNAALEKTKKGAVQVESEAGPSGMACAPASIGGIACQLPTEWKTGNIPSVREVALKRAPNIRYVENRDKPHEKNELAEAIMKSVAGPLVTLTGPDGPLKGGAGVALTGPGLEGRVFRLQGASGKIDPRNIQTILEKHFSQATLVEGLAVETLDSKTGQKPILVYKYIKIDRQKEESEVTDGPMSRAAQNTKITSIPQYHNMAVSIVPKGNDLVLLLVVVQEENFITQFEGFKQLVNSIG